jgi:hypothetical protein
MGAKTALDAWEVDPLLIGSSRGCTSRRCARKVVVSYRDPASSSSLSSTSSSSEAVSEGDSLTGRPSSLSDLTLLCGVFLSLLLRHRNASRLSSSAIFRNRWL